MSATSLSYLALGPASLLKRMQGWRSGWQYPGSGPIWPRHEKPVERVLGLSCHYHDSAVALVESGRISFAMQEERLSRRKHDSRFPMLALSRALGVAGISMSEIDEVAFYENPNVKFDRIWNQILHDWPNSSELHDFHAPYFWHHKRPVEQQIRDGYNYSGPISLSEHHRSHAASSFFTSPFERALVVTIDGLGEFETIAVHLGEGNELRKLKSLHFPHSLGLLYSVFTQYLGFEVNEGEYKVMGLAPYGSPTMVDRILGPLIRLEPDGSFALNQAYFTFSNPARHYHQRLVRHLGIQPREPRAPVKQEHQDLAASIQRVLEMAMHNMLRALIATHDVTNFCFAGGVVLNCTANAQMIRELGICSHIHPAAGDAGAALGAALDAAVRGGGNRETQRFSFSPYLGLQYTEEVAAAALEINGVEFRRSEQVSREVAAKLADGQVVAILHGRDEWGPRALGGRSILADPRTAQMKDHLNAKIKFREEFRPFAPVVLEEHYGDYFETLGMPSSPYMLYTHRSLQPEKTAAVTHADQTSRVQTVSREQNAYLYDIIAAFRDLTGVPVITNTSFNLKGEPIVSSPTDALKTFLASGIDCLAIENLIVEKPCNVSTVREVIELPVHGGHAAWQAFYMKPRRAGLIPSRRFMVPNTSAIPAAEGVARIYFETNSLGLKGREPETNFRQAVVWGDSVIFGIGAGWISELDSMMHGWQFHNGGIEGDPVINILDRAAGLQERLRPDLNVLFPGWHPSAGSVPVNDGFEAALEEGIRRLRSVVLVTLPTSLNSQVVSQNISPFLGDTAYGPFALWGALAPTVTNATELYHRITERNAMIRSVAKRLGIPIFDWFAAMPSEARPDFREEFMDAGHPRPSAYPRIIEMWAKGLLEAAPVLQSLSNSDVTA